MRITLNDCLTELKTMEENSVDSIVTDPPYGLAFMGKQWDYDVPSVEIWKECLRVLKPGGHLLAFASSRTYHRMAINIEDAGFEIRDQIMWVYGSGFPKSHNVGKAIDKIQGNQRKIVGERKVLDITGGNYKNTFDKTDKHFSITKGNTEWEGWGTALKPAHEPIVMARKPLEGTVAENVLEYGTGAINIDACRVEYADDQDGGDWNRFKGYQSPDTIRKNLMEGSPKVFAERIDNGKNASGRWPANIMFDEEAGKMLDEQSGTIKSSGGTRKKDAEYNASSYDIVHPKGLSSNPYAGEVGGASRFFYCPKANKKERGDGNIHPTVKPIALMEYLIKLITPEKGIVLDPFMGSGTTGIAAVGNDFDFIGIEREKEYYKIAKARIKSESLKRKFF